MDIDSWIDSVTSSTPQPADAASSQTPPTVYSDNGIAANMLAVNTGVFDPRYVLRPFKTRQEPLPDALEQLVNRLAGIAENGVKDATGIFPFMYENRERDMILSLGFRNKAFCAKGKVPSAPHLLSSNCTSISWNSRICRYDGHELASWNVEVHSRVLQEAFRDRPAAESGPASESEPDDDNDKEDKMRTNYRYCPTAILRRRYVDRLQGNASAEFFITLPHRDCDQWNSIRQASVNLNLPINHMNGGSLDMFPLAMPIKTNSFLLTKRESQGHLARLLMAQWMWLQEPYEPGPPVPFLPGIFVDQDSWFLYALVPRDEQPNLILKDLYIGSTANVADLYQLLLSLREIRRWIEDTYRPVVMEHVFDQVE